MDVPIEKKIGQMLLVGFRGLETKKDHWLVKGIKKYGLGGTVFFDSDIYTKKSIRNIQTPMQVKKLSQSLQDFSEDTMFISIDQEGGKVVRLKEKYGFSPTVTAQYLGNLNDLYLTHHYATGIAQELDISGINLNLAPVVDLNINKENPIIGKLERSFSDVPDVVTNHALVFIKSHHDVGVLCALKHFPGHGSSSEDSHHGLVDITQTWTDKELIPYQNIVRAGEADAIVTAHVFNAHLDPNFPATLSKPIITGILREKIGFDGVVITDDMQMGAIINHYGFRTAITKSIEAGVDVITIGNNLVYQENIIKRTVEWIHKLVKRGIITEERIDESYKRIQNLKNKLSILKTAAEENNI